MTSTSGHTKWNNTHHHHDLITAMAGRSEKPAAARPPPLPLGEGKPPPSNPSSQPQSPRTPRAKYGGKGPFGFGGPSSSSSRPQSAVSRKSAHAPGYAAQAFFHPMSSQQLQMQRASRPMTASSENEPRLSTSSEQRGSLESRDPNAQFRVDLPPPASLEGSDSTARQQPFRSSSPVDRNTIHTADSTKPLNTPPKARQEANRRDITPKTPNSYQLPSRGQEAPPPPMPTHNALVDRRGSDESHRAQKQEREQKALSAKGRNYKYFTGNTVFCWGGRFQNTRHRPVNIFTGLAILVPVVIFFVFT
jgi:palmitoyltransferase ZDHHC9/14/18